MLSLFLLILNHYETCDQPFVQIKKKDLVPCLTPEVRPQGHAINRFKRQRPGSQREPSQVPRDTRCGATPATPIRTASGACSAPPRSCKRKTTTLAFFIGVRHEKPLLNFKQNLRKAPEVSERFPITFLSFRGPLRSLLYSKFEYFQKTLIPGM